MYKVFRSVCFRYSLFVYGLLQTFSSFHPSSSTSPYSQFLIRQFFFNYIYAFFKKKIKLHIKLIQNHKSMYPFPRTLCLSPESTKVPSQKKVKLYNLLQISQEASRSIGRERKLSYIFAPFSQADEWKT